MVSIVGIPFQSNAFVGSFTPTHWHSKLNVETCCNVTLCFIATALDPAVPVVTRNDGKEKGRSLSRAAFS